MGERRLPKASNAMADPHKESNIAVGFDRDKETFDSAVAEIISATELIRSKLEAGEYAEHLRAGVAELLSRCESDPELFLFRVRGAGGASPERLLSVHGQRHGMDGHNLPQEDAYRLAAALTKRNTARDDMRASWPKLLPQEQAKRTCP